jgi:hypothetical protein
MKRALIAAVVMATWPLAAGANTPAGADASGAAPGEIRLSRQVDEQRDNAVRRVARDESIHWSEPFYRYGHREPAMEELATTGGFSDPRAAAHRQPTHRKD